MEYAESAFLKEFSLSLCDKNNNYAWPRCKVYCEYFGSANYNDTILISLKIKNLGRTSLEYVFEFSVKNEKIAEGGYIVVFTYHNALTGKNKAQPIPEPIKIFAQKHIINI
jgi:acyl-CoA thioesterase FadM